MQFPEPPEGRWIYLSHVLAKDTPAYGGGAGLDVTMVRDIAKGDSCNASQLAMSNHLGSHVDAPLHFVAGGRGLDNYRASEWVFTKALVVDAPMRGGGVLSPDHFKSLQDKNIDADFLLIRTGFEKKRSEDVYWSNSPAFSPDLAGYFQECLPSLKAIGLDTISIGSLAHRDMGRVAHQEFLGRGLRIFEDLALEAISGNEALQMVIALPLRFKNADGAPCTIIGLIN